MRQRILIIRFGSLGDVILTSATVRNLKLNFPDSEISFLTKARFAPVVRLLAGVDDIIETPDRQTIAEWYALIDRLDSYQFDTILDLHGKFSSWLVRRLVTANNRLVYPKRRWERYRLVKTNRIPSEWPHTIDLYNSTVRRLGGTAFCRRPFLASDRLPEIKCPWPDNQPALVIAPGAAHSTKQWPADRFALTAVQVARQFQLHVVWVTEKPEVLPDSLREIPPTRFHPVANWSVDALAALCGRATAVLSNDSGLMHLASAVGTPVVAIFGPTHPALGFSPRGLQDRVVETDEPCRPCSLHGKTPCHREEQFCFTRIHPDRVANELNEVISRRLNASPALFVDRDGTVLVNKHYVNDPEQVEFESGALDGLKLATAAGYKIVVISNQSGIARGLTTEDEVRQTNTRMREMLAQNGIPIAGSYFCPHHATEGTVARYTTSCDCRKPGVGMVEQAAAEHNLDLQRSVVIGDSLVDINLGRAAGIRPLLVRTGYGQNTEAALRASQFEDNLLVGDNLRAVVHLLVEAAHD